VLPRGADVEAVVSIATIAVVEAQSIKASTVLAESESLVPAD
jgi:hypothetical protein